MGTLNPTDIMGHSPYGPAYVPVSDGCQIYLAVTYCSKESNTGSPPMARISLLTSGSPDICTKHHTTFHSKVTLSL